jgi:predicted ATP-grasp superfamily ATP-dependent carboligase
MTHFILVLDAAQRSALAVTRSLGKLGNIHITTADSSKHALAGASKYSNRYLQSPCPSSNPAGYIEWLDNLCQQESFSLVIPVTEITSQLLLIHAQRLTHVKLPFADYATVMSVADKYRLLLQAQQCSIPAPQFTLVNNAGEADASTWEYPCVIKPCLSKIFTPEGWIATSVKVLHSAQEWQDHRERAPYLEQYPFMVQEFIPGSGAGVFCLYDKGRATHFFAHKRLREKPPQGGVSVLSESVAVDPALKSYAQQLLDHVNWHGVAMVEFRIMPEGKPYLMEVNTRFWGSLQLAIDSGVDFPALLLRHELNEAAMERNQYHIGQRLRWLLGDLDSLYLYLKSDYTLLQKLRRIGQFLLPSTKTRHETNRLEDFGPGIYEFKTYLRQLLGR